MQKVWLLYISIASYIKEVSRHLVPFLFADKVLRVELELSYTICIHKNALSTDLDSRRPISSSTIPGL